MSSRAVSHGKRRERDISVSVPSTYFDVVDAKLGTGTDSWHRRGMLAGYASLLALLVAGFAVFPAPLFEHRARLDYFQDGGHEDSSAKACLALIAAFLFVVLVHLYVYNFAVARVRFKSLLATLAAGAMFVVLASVLAAQFPPLDAAPTPISYGVCTYEDDEAPALCRSLRTPGFFARVPWSTTCPAGQNSFLSSTFGSVSVATFDLWATLAAALLPSLLTSAGLRVQKGCVPAVLELLCHSIQPRCDRQCNLLLPCQDVCTRAATSCGIAIDGEGNSTVGAIGLTIDFLRSLPDGDVIAKLVPILFDTFNERCPLASPTGRTQYTCERDRNFGSNSLLMASRSDTCSHDGLPSIPNTTRFTGDASTYGPKATAPCIRSQVNATRKAYDAAVAHRVEQLDDRERWDIVESITVAVCLVLTLSTPALWRWLNRRRHSDVVYFELWWELTGWAAVALSALGLAICGVMLAMAFTQTSGFGYSVLFVFAAIISGQRSLHILFWFPQRLPTDSKVFEGLDNPILVGCLSPLKTLHGLYVEFFGLEGKYGHSKIVALEAVEVLIQIININDTATNTDGNKLIFLVVLLTVNVFVSPLLLLIPSPNRRRDYTLMFDMLVDIAFIVTTIWVRAQTDVNDVFAVSLVWPAFFQTVRARSLSTLWLRQRWRDLEDGAATNTLRSAALTSVVHNASVAARRKRISFSSITTVTSPDRETVDKLELARLDRQSPKEPSRAGSTTALSTVRGSTGSTQSMQSTQSVTSVYDKSVNPCRRKTRVAAAVVVALGGLVLGSSFAWRMYTQQTQCNDLVGEVVWEASSPKIYFPNGIFQPSSCKFSAIDSLTLSNKQLSVVPSSLHLYTALHTLDLSHNRISELSDVLTQLPSLQRADLSFNLISSPPPHLLTRVSQSIESIDFANNSMAYVLDWRDRGLVTDNVTTETVKHIRGSLAVVDLENNWLSSLPSALEQLPALDTLSVSRNRLTSAGNVLSISSKVRVLNFSHNLLTSLSLGAAGLPIDLTSLDISYNLLTSISSSVGRYDRELNVEGNDVTALLWKKRGLNTLNPAVAQLSSSVKLLNVYENSPLRLKNDSLPWLSQMQQLLVLNLAQTGATSVPLGVYSLTGLRVLMLGENEFHSLPPDIGQLTQLRALSLVENQVTSLPTQIGNLRRLKVLEMDMSSQDPTCPLLPWLEIVVPRLPYLEILGADRVCSGNISAGRRLAEAPGVFGNLTRLTSLSLGLTSLTRIPASLANCTTLQVLKIWGNPLVFDVASSSVLKALTALRYLDLNYVSLSHVPEEVFSSPQLQILGLTNTSLVSLPSNDSLWMAVPRLSVLSVDGNNLTALPPVVANLTSLALLNLNGNSFQRSVPWEAEQLLMGNTSIVVVIDVNATVNNVAELDGRVTPFGRKIVCLTNPAELPYACHNRMDASTGTISRHPLCDEHVPVSSNCCGVLGDTTALIHKSYLWTKAFECDPIQVNRGSDKHYLWGDEVPLTSPLYAPYLS